MHSIVNWTWAFGVAALLFAWYKAMYVNRQDAGTEKMAEIASYIREGATAFLKREYSVLAVFAIAVAILLFIANYSNGTQLVGISFLVGATCSGLAGVFGMRVATRANVRAANAARQGLAGALNVAFSGGSVMGMSVVGLGVLGLVDPVPRSIPDSSVPGSTSCKTRYCRSCRDSVWVPHPSRSSLVSEAASTRSQPMWAQTS